LYEILLRLVSAAEKGDKDEVVKINKSEFNPKYFQVFPEVLTTAYSPDSLPCLYDLARNNCLYAISFPNELRKEKLKDAKKYLSKIPKKELS